MAHHLYSTCCEGPTQSLRAPSRFPQTRRLVAVSLQNLNSISPYRGNVYFLPKDSKMQKLKAMLKYKLNHSHYQKQYFKSKLPVTAFNLHNCCQQSEGNYLVSSLLMNWKVLLFSLMKAKLYSISMVTQATEYPQKGMDSLLPYKSDSVYIHIVETFQCWPSHSWATAARSLCP